MPSSPDATLPPPSRPVRKDEIELHERGLYIESWLPERRSRRKPLLFVHGELGGSWAWERFLGYFAGRGWEGHALNLRNHHWSQTADPAELSFESFVEDVGAAIDRLGSGVVAVGHGMGALLVLKAAERHPVSGLVLIAPEAPGDVRAPTEPHRIREVPELFGPSLLGWATLPEKLQRDHPDLAL
ncbi:MAG TPA: alpha/beta fold hydrolase, partial [Candidatus Limnocylindria bacterium]|nr:alpha/beta fold hydrolase [Candidatus Limnocylindria bacterium]